MSLPERDVAAQAFLTKEARDEATIEQAKAEIIKRLHLLTQRISRDAVKEWLRTEFISLSF